MINPITASLIRGLASVARHLRLALQFTYIFLLYYVIFWKVTKSKSVNAKLKKKNYYDSTVKKFKPRGR